MVVDICSPSGRQRQMNQSTFEVSFVYTTSLEFEWPRYSPASDHWFRKLCSKAALGMYLSDGGSA